MNQLEAASARATLLASMRRRLNPSKASRSTERSTEERAQQCRAARRVLVWAVALDQRRLSLRRGGLPDQVAHIPHSAARIGPRSAIWPHRTFIRSTPRPTSRRRLASCPAMSDRSVRSEEQMVYHYDQRRSLVGPGHWQTLHRL
jgi:hypothetical protein